MDDIHVIDTLNDLLKGEHMAINIYDKTKNIQGDSQVQEMLHKFQQDHIRHAAQLTERIEILGGNAKAGIGLPGVMADVSSVINAYRGPEHLLKQLYDGEDKGIHAYEDRIDEIDSGSQNLVKKIMEEDHEHLKYFQKRMEEEKKEKEQ